MHVVYSYGYENCPEFLDIVSAREHLRFLVQDSLRKCRSKYGHGTKHNLGDDRYLITIGVDRDSAIWAAHHIESD